MTAGSAPSVTRTELEQIATLLAGSLSEGRRRRAVLDSGPARAFQTDLRTISVPLPMPDESTLRAMTCALVLQASPTKEALAREPWTELSHRRRTALAWEEGEAAVRWARRRWPGLRRELDRLFDWVADEEPELDGAALLERAAARGGATEPPPLFGRLPLPRPREAAGTGRRTSIATRWSSRHRARRVGGLPIPVSGPGTEPVLDPGEPGTMEALAGRSGHAIGIPYDEWDRVRGTYRRGHVRVLELPGPVGGVASTARLDLPRPAPATSMRRGLDSGDVDIDSVVRWRCELASGYVSADPKLFSRPAPRPEPVAWALLIDASASSSLSGGDVLRRSVGHADALARTLADRGELVGVYAFRSHGRERVEVRVLKHFDSRYRPLASALKPAGYTRLGAAIRHAGERLLATPARAHVLLSLGDALPYDEGYGEAFGRADVAKAVEELRERGAWVVHGAPVTQDEEALGEMFGPFGWRHARRAIDLLPLIEDVHDQIRRSG